MSLFFIIHFANATLDRTDKKYCEIEHLTPKTYYKLANGQLIPREIKITGAVKSYILKGHGHLPPHTDRTSFFDHLLDTSSNNKKYLEFLNQIAKDGILISEYRLPDLKSLRGSNPGTLFVEETPSQVADKMVFKVEYELFKKNLIQRGLLPENQHLFDQVSSILNGESFTYKFENPRVKIKGIGDEELFSRHERALTDIKTNLSKLKDLVSPSVFEAFTNNLKLFTESSLESLNGISEMNKNEILKPFSDPNTRSIAEKSFFATVQFNSILAQRDKLMARDINSDAKGLTPKRTLHVGALHLKRLTTLIQEQCMSDLAKQNQEIIRMARGKPKDLFMHLMFRGPDGKVVSFETLNSNRNGDQQSGAQ